MKKTKILLENKLVEGIIVNEETIEAYHPKHPKEYKRYIVDVHHPPENLKYK